MRSLVVAILFGGFVAAPTIAQAQPAVPDDAAKRKASAHYKQGKAFFDAGAFDKAVSEFRAAYDLAPANPLLFNIARSYHLSGGRREAAEWYTKYLDVEADGSLADEARQYRAELAKDLARELAAEKAMLATAQTAKKRELADAHVKQAKAHAAAGNPGAAAAEHVAAFDIDGDSEHLFAAAEAANAVGKTASAKEIADANVAALALYRRYVETTPSGPRADAARVQVALLAKQVDDASRLVPPGPTPDKPPLEPRDARVVGMGSAAKTAADRGDCRVARTLADRVRDEDPEYYDAVVVPGISACSKASSDSASRRGPRRVGGGVEFRIGFIKSNNSDRSRADPEFMRLGPVAAKALANLAPAIGGFVDVAAAPQLRARFGLRVRYVSLNYDSQPQSDSCIDPTLCPTSVSALLGGPAISLEPSLRRDKTSDVHLMFGTALQIPLNSPVFKVNDQGSVVSGPGVNTQIELEAGIGLRFGTFFVNGLGNVMLTKLSDGAPDVGRGISILISFGWTSMR